MVPHPEIHCVPRDNYEPPLIPLPKFAYEGYLKDFTNPKSKSEVKAIYKDAPQWSQMIARNNATAEIDLTAEVCYKFIEDGDDTDQLLRDAISRIRMLMQVRGAERTGIAALVDIAQISRSRAIMRDIAYAIQSVFDDGDNKRWFDDLVLEELGSLAGCFGDTFDVVMSRLG